MLMMYLNSRGLASLPKKLVVQRLIIDQRPNIVFLQETMCEGKGIILVLQKNIVGWNFEFVDGKGMSGGLII